MIWADCLFVLCAAEIISLFGQMHEKVHAQVAYQLLGLLVDPRLLRQLLHDQLLHRGFHKNKKPGQTVHMQIEIMPSPVRKVQTI